MKSENLTARLRNLRLEAGKSQSAVAKLIFVAQRTYSDYERGKIRIPSDCLIRLAKIYNADMNYILGVSDFKNPFPRAAAMKGDTTAVISRRLTELRVKGADSQKNIAGIINVKQRTYSDYERGKTRISVAGLIALAKYFDVDMNYFMGVSDAVKPFPAEHKPRG